MNVTEVIWRFSIFAFPTTGVDKSVLCMLAITRVNAHNKDVDILICTINPIGTNNK